ncbi:zf-HC2 domain-containing protein [Bacillus suaedae]|uniref:Zf-HC2 domain-containing protein n=1 Tax=Halalkalibacter suaedae TaxID=2822140 RepID=A0A940WWJ8_9BACI|nr:zf-HC2 domain-containing protein [Bacillus suaedae]MBP3953656.1 zf-HC2 domain-containing protein [Bacillus suaedae]
MSKVSCEIIKDLLPLYYDSVCSDDSKRMVEEHLSKCNNCKMELERIQDEIHIPKIDNIENRKDSNVIKNISASWKRLRLKSFIKGGIISALLITTIILGYAGLFNWNITSVDTDVVEISDISQMEDGKIFYYAQINDGYSLNSLKYDMDNEGNFYITPLRPILVREKSQPPYALEKGYDFIDIKEQELVRGKEIKTIYYGTPKDKILIWKKGMELPETSAEAKKNFGFE